MKKLSNAEAELKKSVAYKKTCSRLRFRFDLHSQILFYEAKLAKIITNNINDSHHLRFHSILFTESNKQVCNCSREGSHFYIYLITNKRSTLFFFISNLFISKYPTERNLLGNF